MAHYHGWDFISCDGTTPRYRCRTCLREIEGLLTQADPNDPELQVSTACWNCKCDLPKRPDICPECDARLAWSCLRSYPAGGMGFQAAGYDDYLHTRLECGHTHHEHTVPLDWIGWSDKPKTGHTGPYSIADALNAAGFEERAPGEWANTKHE